MHADILGVNHTNAGWLSRGQLVTARVVQRVFEIARRTAQCSLI